MNRVASAIKRAKAQLEARLASGETTPHDVQRLHGELDMDLGEFCRLQELKSLAQLEGRLTQDEAQTVYGFLGNTPDHFNRQPVEAKTVLTMLFGELLARQTA